MSITLWLLAAIISVSAVTYAVLYAGGAVNRWFCVVLPVGVLLYLWFAGDLFRADAILIVKFFSVCFGAWLVANIRFDGWLGRSWGGGLGFAILSINIGEVIGFEIYRYVSGGAERIYGGHLLNIAAGLFLMVTQALPRKLTVGTDLRRNVRYDLGLGWVLIYSVWDFAFIYGIVTPGNDHNVLGGWALVHLLTPLLLVLVVGRDSALYIQMRALSLAIALAFLVCLPYEPFIYLTPHWYDPTLAGTLAAVAFVGATCIAAHDIWSLRRTGQTETPLQWIILRLGLASRDLHKEAVP